MLICWLASIFARLFSCLLSSRPVKELTINFNHETKAGDKVVIYRAVVEKEDEIHVYVEGKVEEVSSFIAELVF